MPAAWPIHQVGDGASVKYVVFGAFRSQVFHPERVAGRILGMGDMLTLIERRKTLSRRKKPKAMARSCKGHVRFLISVPRPAA